MRDSCDICTLKHLGQAAVLCEESVRYPHHMDLAIGHMAEAEAESRFDYPNVEEKIREARVAWANNRIEPNFDDLIIYVRIQVGRHDLYAADNNKHFAHTDES